jgi:uncharacterized membrane protein
MQNLQQHRADVETAQKEAREAQAWLQFLIAKPEVSNCQSNRQLAAEYHNGSEMTLASLLDSFESPAFKEMLAYVNPEKQRAESLATIERITGSIPVTAKYETDEALAKKATDLQTRREMLTKTPQELKAIIQAAKPVPVERELPAEMTRKVLINLPPAELKAILRTYGSPAVNKRLAGQ